MKKLSSLSIFFPCLNDGKTIPTLVAKAYKAGKRVTKSLEVIIIENGSDKDTIIALKKLQKQYPRLRILWFKKPLGYGGALQQGIAHATKDWVFYTDGDGQYDPLELSRLVSWVRPEVDVINGYKLSRSDSGFRRIAGSFYNTLLHRIYPLPVRDVDCDFRLMRKSLLRGIRLTSTSALVCVELVMSLKRAGARFSEVGVSHFPRISGRSEFFRPSHLVRSLADHIAFALRYTHIDK